MKQHREEQYQIEENIKQQWTSEHQDSKDLLPDALHLCKAEKGGWFLSELLNTSACSLTIIHIFASANISLI